MPAKADLQAQLKASTMGQGEMALPPSFSNPEEERTYLKQRLAAAYRVFAMLGFDDGLAGHITARDPVEPESFWVNPLGKYFGHIRASDLVRVDHSGNLVDGRALINKAAFAIHSRLHAARPDVIAVAHSHSPAGRAFSTLGIELAPISQDACVFFEDHAVYSEFHGVVNETEEGDRIAAALGDRKAAILQNHGIITTGQSVDSAVGLYVQMERCCDSQLRAMAAGEFKTVPAEIARQTRAFNGQEIVLWGNFQPLYQQVEASGTEFKQ